MLGFGCARSPEAQTARYLDRGDSYLKKARYREAIIEYENALRIQRTDPRATRQLGLAHYQLGEFGQAARYLLKAEELAPDQLDVRLKLGALYILDRRWKEAQAEADYVLARDPRNLEALLLVADAAATAEEVESAVQRLEATRTALGDPPRLRVALANLHVRKQDVTGAESLLQGAVQEDPKSIEAHAALAELDLLKGDHASVEREFQAAAALAPLASPARIRLAHYFVLARRSADARRVLGEVTAKAPRYLPAWRLLAEIALAEGRLDDADKALKPVFKRNPQDLDGHLLKGRVFLARKSSELAILEFQQVLKLEPRLAAAHYQLALAHLQGGNVQQAKAELKETITISPDHVEARLRLAQLNLEAGAVDPAIEDMTRLVAAQPRLLEGYVLLGAAHLQKNEPGKALEIYRKLAAVAPKDPRSPYLVGIGLLAEGKLAEARKSLETALALAPGYIDALAQLVRLDLLDKKPEAAVGRVRQQIEAAGDSGGPQELLGGVLETQQKSELAEAAYLRAIELEPGLMGAYLGLAQLYTRAGRLDLALLKADEALKANPRDVAIFMLIGTIYELKGDTAKAEASFPRVLEIDPNFAPAANNLAYRLAERGADMDRALKLAQRAREGAREKPRIADTLGWILYKRGSYQDALPLLREAAAKLPDSPVVQYHLGTAAFKAGDRDMAQGPGPALGASEKFAGKDEARRLLAELR